MAQVSQFTSLQPKKYAVALCSRNVWGVIMVDEPKEIQFSDGTSTCWTGFACRSTVVPGWGKTEGQSVVKDVGDTWASRNPQVIAYLDGMENKSLKEVLAAARSVLSARNL